MMLPSLSRIRFGLFEVDPRSGELRRNGYKIDLQDQPFQALMLLLEHPGEVVTRDDLRRHLWPQDTFVDFDRGLNKAINKLRYALRDNADKPQYIETLPQRGYRFIAIVKPSISLPSEAEVSAVEITSVEVSSAPQESPATLESIKQRIPGGRTRQKYLYYGLALTCILGAAIGGRFLLMPIRARVIHRLTPTDTIVVSDFSNSTGDVVFDETLKTALEISLRQSPFLNLLPDSEVANTLKLMTLPASTKLTPEVASDLCERAQSRAYVAGSIASIGSQYVLELKAVNCQSSDMLAQEQVTANAKEKVLDALGQAALKLRGELGESMATMRRFDVPLEQATTPSLEALKAFSVGKKAEGERTSSAALPYSLRAIQLDPNFALAYWAAGWDYIGLSEMERAREYHTRAFQLRDHASEREKLSITGNYYIFVTGELDKAVQANQQRVNAYPRDFDGYTTLGVVCSYLGQYEKAVGIERQALLLAPPRADIYNSLARDIIALQRFGEARQILSEEQARKLEHGFTHTLLYGLAFLGSDAAGMAEQQNWFAGKPEENIGLALASDSSAYAGHLAQARKLIRQAVDSAISADSKESGAISQAISAHREAAFGNATVARQSAEAALKLAPLSQGVESEAALAFAIAGDTARASSLARDLEKRFPLDTQIHAHWLPAIHAQLELNRKNPRLALNALQADSAVELGNVSFANSISCLYPVYLRGEAYLAAGQGDAAAREFQKILDHSGIVWNCWTGALAHLGVARANALQSRTENGPDVNAAHVRAIAAYNDFFALWRDADPEIPIFKQAKTEYAKLQSRVT